MDGPCEYSQSFRGDAEASNCDVQFHIGESRDSGSGPSDHPGMTGLLRFARNDNGARIRATHRLAVTLVCAAVSRPSRRNNLLTLLAEPFDAQRDDVADIEELRRLHAGADAG